MGGKIFSGSIRRSEEISNDQSLKRGTIENIFYDYSALESSEKIQSKLISLINKRIVQSDASPQQKISFGRLDF